MNALYDHNAALGIQMLHFLCARLGGKIKHRQIAMILFNQLLQALLDAGKIQRHNVFIILAAVGQTGINILVQIKIIQADHLCRAPAQSERMGQLVRRGGFAAGRRAGEHYDLAAAFQHSTCCLKYAVFILGFAALHKTLRVFGSHIDEAVFNKTLRDPNCWHSIQSLLLFVLKSYRNR